MFVHQADAPPRRPYNYDVNSKTLGGGRYGSVYKGYLIGTGQPVAVKVARFDDIHDIFIRDSICNECEHLQKLAHGLPNGHPNIVQLIRMFDSGSELSFAMELAICSVRDLLHQPRFGNGMPPDMFRDIVRDTTNGIKHIRKENLKIAHRDIKVDNILVFPFAGSRHNCTDLAVRYNFKLCDFGFSKDTIESSVMGSVVGTVRCWPPQLTLAKAGDPNCTYKAENIDLWALGAAYYECCTGKFPFPSDINDRKAFFRNRSTGTIAVNSRTQNGVTKIENSDFPRYLIECVSRLIVMTYDFPSFETLFDMADELLNVPVIKVATPHVFRIVEHADLSSTKHFRDLEKPLNGVLKLERETGYAWLGRRERYHSKPGIAVKCKDLPFTECIVFPVSARFSGSRKKWTDFISNVRQHENREAAFQRRRQYLSLCWSALKEQDDMIHFVKMIKKILTEQALVIRAACEELLKRAEREQEIVVFMRNKNAVDANQTEEVLRKLSQAMDKIQRVLRHDWELNKVRDMDFEEPDVSPTPAQLHEIGSLSAQAKEYGPESVNFYEHNENWMKTLGELCVQRGNLFSSQIDEMYRKNDGLLYLIRLAIALGAILDQVKQSNFGISGLLGENILHIRGQRIRLLSRPRRDSPHRILSKLRNQPARLDKIYRAKQLQSVPEERADSSNERPAETGPTPTRRLNQPPDLVLGTNEQNDDPGKERRRRLADQLRKKSKPPDILIPASTNRTRRPSTAQGTPTEDKEPRWKMKRQYSSMLRVAEILSAVCAGELQTLERLLESTDLKKSFWLQACHPLTGASLVHLAVIHEKYEILRLLLKQPGMPLWFRDYDGRTALHYAACLAGIENDSTVYYDLIEAGAADTAIDFEGFNPQDIKHDPLLIDMQTVKMSNRYPVTLNSDTGRLFAAVDEEALENMVLNGTYDVNSETEILPEHATLHHRLVELQSRMDGIWAAIEEGDARTLKHLVCDKRMGLCRDSYGRTPLHRAYRTGRIDIVDYLLYICPEAANAKDKEGRVPVEYSLISDSDEGSGSISTLSRRRRRSTNALRRSMPSMLGDLDPEIAQTILNIDLNDKTQFAVLEQLQIEGKVDQIWKTVKKYVSNEKLVRFVNDFRNQQMRLSSAIESIEHNDDKKLRHLVDEDIMAARDSRGMRLLHIAVLRERHEAVEYMASEFPSALDLLDSAGRTALHYAAVQPNAIYDTLIDFGASTSINDMEGFTPEQYRASPDRLVRPLSASSSVIIHTMSMDDDLLDPDAPREEDIESWIASGEVAKLEQLVLDGRGHMLRDKETVNSASKEFLKGLAQYQSKIDAIHKAVEDGDVRRVKSLIDRPPLATARDAYGMTPLHKALLHGQTNTVRYVLAKYPSSVNATDHAGRTALHYAAADPNGEHMIKVLQKSGGDAFIEDKHGHTPFYYRTHGQRLNVRTMKDNAVMSQLISGQLSRPLLQDLEEDIYDWIHTGNVGKLEELVLTGYADLLLGRNHEVEDADSIGFLEVLPQYQAKIAAIHKAVETGNLRAVKLLTDRKKLSLCRDSRGLTPLHKAIVFEKTDIAKYLIRNYPQSVNAMDQKKRSPLHYAAALKDGGYLYKVMRKCGADPNVYDCHGRPAKYYLKHTGEIDLAAMRLDTKAALKQVLHNRVAPSYLESSIQQWIRDGQVAKLEQLVLSGCGDLLQNRTSSNADTSQFLDTLPDYLEKIDGIHRAIKEGDLERVKELMTTKKLAIARDRFGCTPLHAAVVHERTDIVRYIAGHYATVLNAPDYNKRTAMHYAAAARDGGHYLKILGKAGADPMAVDNEGRTPDYYRRNAVIDLKIIKDRDEEFEMISEELLEDGPMIDSPASPDTGSFDSDHIDSARIIDEEEDVDRYRFERMVNARVSHVELPTSENGIYLARTVAPVLTKALAEVLLRRPADPIGFISDWLQKYHNEMPKRTN